MAEETRSVVSCLVTNNLNTLIQQRPAKEKKRLIHELQIPVSLAPWSKLTKGEFLTDTEAEIL